MYSREASLLGATTATGAIAVGLISLSVDVLAESSAPVGKLALLTPLAPPIILGVFLFVYMQSRITGAYIRRLEHVIRNGTGGEPITGFIPDVGTVRFPFYGSLISAIFARSHGNGVYRTVFGLLAWATVAFVAGGSVLIGFAVADLDPSFWWSPILVAVLLGLDFLVYAGTSARKNTVRVLETADEEDRRRFADSGDRRADVGWLAQKMIFPRPTSLGKGVWVLAGYLIGLGLTKFDIAQSAWLDGLLTLAIVELLLNQSRYLVNDLRDWRVDALSSDLSVSRRMGHKIAKPQLLLLVSSVAFRLWLAGWLFGFVSDPYRPFLRIGIGALLVATFVYELARHRLRKAEPGAVTPWVLVWSWVVITVVPVGYVIRLGLGLIAATSVDVPGWPVALFMFAAYSANLSSVTMGWVLASMPSFDDGSASRHELAPSIRGWPHRILLLQHVGLLPEGRKFEFVSTDSRNRHGRYLVRPIEDSRFRSSWYFKFVIFGAATIAGLLCLGAGIAAGATPPDPDWIMVFGLVVGATLVVGRNVTAASWVRSSAPDPNEEAPQGLGGTANLRRIATSQSVRLLKGGFQLSLALGVAAFGVWLFLLGASDVSQMDDWVRSVGEALRRVAFDLDWFASLVAGLLVGVVSLRTMYTDMRGTAGASLNDLRVWPYVVQRFAILGALFIADLPAAALRGSFDVHTAGYPEKSTHTTDSVNSDEAQISHDGGWPRNVVEERAAKLKTAIARSRRTGEQVAQLLASPRKKKRRGGEIYGFIVEEPSESSA